jgi:hypothetical protein
MNPSTRIAKTICEREREGCDNRKHGKDVYVDRQTVSSSEGMKRRPKNEKTGGCD